MEKELIVDGKTYVSSKQAAALTGYTHDYIGQLSRGGKIPGKLVGRVKFVDKEALLAYKQEADAQKEALAQERSNKFKAGRKVPVKQGKANVVKTEGTKHSKNVSDTQPSHSERGTVSDAQKEFSATEHSSAQEARLEEKRTAETTRSTTSSSGEDARLAIPSPLSRTQIAAAVLLLALAGSAFAFPFVAPTVNNGLVNMKEDVQTYTARAADKMESMTHVLLALPHDTNTFAVVHTSDRYANDIFTPDASAGMNDLARPQKRNENIIASVRAKAKEVFTSTPPFALVPNIQSEITESTKYAQIELAYVGAVMEYRFLEVGVDVKTLAKDTAEVMQSISMSIASFATGQSAGVANAAGESTPDIFERSALFVFHTIQPLKEALTSLLSTDLDTFVAPNASDKE